MARSKLNQNRKDLDVKFARNKGVQDEERTMMEKAEKCNSSGDGKDEMESLQNKVALLETKIDELEEKERISREKQGKAAKVTAQLEQEVKSMREVLMRSFKVAPKDPFFPKSRKAMRKRQKQLEEDLASLGEHCAINAGNLAKVKLEQDDLSNQLEGLHIMEEPRERTCQKDQESDSVDYSGGWPYSSDEEIEWSTEEQKNKPGLHIPAMLVREI